MSVETPQPPHIRGELVLRRDDDGIATLTLNRPDKLNALTPALFACLRAHLDLLADDVETRCVILTGAGGSFCAGHDVQDLATRTAEQQLQHEKLQFEADTIDRLESLPMPTIAKIRGHCLTGGLELALGCDILVASRNSSIGDTHGRWGLAPIWGMSVRLPERVGPSAAKDLMFTSRRVDGATAARLGLVDRCTEDSTLDAEVDRLAAEIRANSDGTNRIVKALMKAASSMNRNDGLQHERRVPFGRPEDGRARMATWATRRGPARGDADV